MNKLNYWNPRFVGRKGITGLLLFLSLTLQAQQNRFFSVFSEQNNQAHNSFWSEVQDLTNDRWRVDSIHEEVFDGYNEYFNAWYFYYSHGNKPDSMQRFYYYPYVDEAFTRVDEHYDVNGNIVLFQQYEYPKWIYDSDTGIIAKIDYVYEGDRLLYKKEVSQFVYNYSQDNSEIYFFYSPDGKLIKDSTKHTDMDDIYVNNYFYTESGLKEYELSEHLSPEFDYQGYSMIKYIYAFSDSSKETMIINKELDTLLTHQQLDSISNFGMVKYFLEQYDPAGRLKRFSFYEGQYGPTASRNPEHQAVYEYNELGKIQLQTYSRWEGDRSSGYYSPITYRNYTYDSQGRRIRIDQYFYDERTQNWEPENVKQYFYSATGAALAIFKLRHKAIIIYPNPANTKIHITGLGQTSFRYSIMNISGEIVQLGEIISNTIDVNHLPKGIYQLVVNSDCELKTGCFLKN